MSGSNNEPQLVRFTGTFFSGLGGNGGGHQQQQSADNHHNNNSSSSGPRTASHSAVVGLTKSSAIAHARPLNNTNNSSTSKESGIRRGRHNTGDSGDQSEIAAADAGTKGGPVRPQLRFGSEASGKQLQHDISWLELGLCKALTRAVTHLGYLHPTPVQSAAIPHIITGHDVVARAVTGSGKTAALMLPLVHRLVTTRAAGGSSKFVTADGAPKKNVMNGLLRSLVLLPSRELGMQVHDFAFSLAQFCDSLKTVLVIGGVAAQAQEAALAAGADIVVATPGRIIDLLYNYSNIETARHTPWSSKSGATSAGNALNRGRKFDLSGVEMVALDECDELLSSETLRPQIEDIFTKFLPPMDHRQTILLSATLTKKVDDFIENNMKDDLRVVDIGHVAFAAQLRQHFIRCGNVSTLPSKKKAVAATTSEREEGEEGKKSTKKKSSSSAVSTSDDIEGGNEESVHSSKRKTPYLVVACRKFYGAESALQKEKSNKNKKTEDDLLDEDDETANASEKRVLIFAKYRSTVHRLCCIFQQLGFKAAELRGDLDIEARSQAINDFSSGIVNYLFTTDVASRGLDLPAVSTVINFDLPPTLSSYVHRVGRTARIGHPGVAVSLVDDDTDGDLMRRIMSLSKSESSHQVASVKRREVAPADVAVAADEILTIFPRVKAMLASEVVEKQLETAEKKMQHLDNLTSRQQSLHSALSTSTAKGGDKKVSRVAAVAAAVLPAAKKVWTLSKSERNKREEAAKTIYKQELESKLSYLQQEADAPNALIERANKTQIDQRRREREKQAAKDAKVKEFQKAQRKRQLQKVQAGAVKKIKQKKLRQARMEERKEKREAAGVGKAGKKRQGSQKKSATRKKFKRH